MFKRIYVPLDGSALAERALPYAEELAGLLGTSIHIVRVVDVAAFERYTAYGFAPIASEELIVDEEAQCEAYLGEIQREMTSRGYHVSTEKRRGTVVAELAAATAPGDLVVMASHGRGGLTRVFLGSVAEDMVRRSAAPVLLVRTDHAAPLHYPVHREARPVLAAS
jgi:nucleotide-binding universal stress UspA family protein